MRSPTLIERMASGGGGVAVESGGQCGRNEAGVNTQRGEGW